MERGYVDAHTHAYMLPKKDLELMSLAGVSDIVLCSFVPVATYPETLMDHFEELEGVHYPRLLEQGINAHIFVGIHPMSIPKDWKKLLPVIEEYITSGRAVGIGEVGLHTASNIEVEVLREQLKIAKEYEVPAILHIPPGDKRIEVVHKILELVGELKIDPGRVVIDHVSDDIIDIVNDAGAVPGLSIKPPLLTPERVAKNIEKYENGLLNSDCASLTDTDPLAVPRTVKYLKMRGIEKRAVEKLAYLNAQKTLKIK
ncbi:hydrolase TatD [Thermococcus sp. M39]|uniref:TatD family hydrolase n=1 Tax=Thermococcus sp. M39 TaxID=1638262 RepID=UPI00143B0BB3|nr:TatD family hydrolase [Thermococcus sp. M39]NJE07643.1 hydrolase TatD [Thermococcus sp. M39]